MNFFKILIKRIFQYEAQLVLRRYKPKVIAIVGSVGKTTTRDAIYLLLSKKYFVRKSEKSFTAELGVPLAIIGCEYGTGSVNQWISNLLEGLQLLLVPRRYPEWLILEIDGDKPGDISGISRWLSPDIVVVTAIGDIPAHIESFGSKEFFMAEKRHILDTLGDDGLVIYNADDTIATQLVSSVTCRKISCALGEKGDVKATKPTILYAGKQKDIPIGLTYDITLGDNHGTLTHLNVLGIHVVYASLLAIAIGIEKNIPWQDCIGLGSTLSALPGRMKIIQGINDSVIIDDSYNASPLAMDQALDVCQQIQTTHNKILVVGDMLELGKYSADSHRHIAERAKDIMQYVFCVGIRAQRIYEELINLGFDKECTKVFDRAELAGLATKEVLGAGDIVLVKGSQAMRMERVVEQIMRHPEDASQLLVRQEPEWIERD